VTTDFNLADERLDRIDAIEKNTTALIDEIDKKAGDVDSRDDALVDLLDVLRESQQECATLREHVAALQNGEISESDEVAGAPFDKSGLHSSDAVARLDQVVANTQVCQTVLECEPAVYDELIGTCERMIRQGHRDQPISTALRLRLAELLEQRLPRASAEAVITYIRLVLDQLDEYQLGGADPTFRMMIPQTGGSHQPSPVISDKTREREMSALDMTLRSYDAGRQLPAEEDTWADLEPIFAKLFEAYGEHKVSTLYDPDAPNLDKCTTYDISRSLYSEILKLPQENAANVMRWLLTP
jgi:hypothetical protein